MVSLVLALLGAFVLPVLLTSGTADAWGCNPRVDVGTDHLEFTAIKGVNPAAQTIEVCNQDCGTLWWKVSDDARWLSASPSWGTNRGEEDFVQINVNSKNLAVGEYDAIIKVSNIWRSSDYMTVQVHLTVVEPMVKGPIMIGMEGIWPWSPDYVYDGTSANLLLAPCNGGVGPIPIELPCGFEDLSGAGIEVKDCWHMSLDVDLAAGMITGGTLSGNGDLPSGEVEGYLLGLDALLPGVDLGDNYLVVLTIDAGDQGILNYLGMLLTDIGGLLDAIPDLMNMLGSTSSSSGIEAMNQGIVIPLGPVMDILPKLLPLMEDLLPKLLPLIQPIAGLIPPVIVIMPTDLMMELMALLMP